MKPVTIDRRKGTIIGMIVLWLYVVVQLAAFYHARWRLTSPLIPQSLVWTITKTHIFAAGFAAGMGVIVLPFFFFKRYVPALILSGVGVIGGQFMFYIIA